MPTLNPQITMEDIEAMVVGKKIFLDPPKHSRIRRLNARWDSGIIEAMMTGEHFLYKCRMADMPRWAAIWMYLNDIAEGRA